MLHFAASVSGVDGVSPRYRILGEFTSYSSVRGRQIARRAKREKELRIRTTLTLESHGKAWLPVF